MANSAYTDPNYKKMQLYSSRAVEYFKHWEYWIEKLTPCELAYLFVVAANTHTPAEVLLNVWHTEQEDPDYELRGRSFEHYIGIPSLELFFSFDMEISTDETEEDGDYGTEYYIEVSDVTVDKSTLTINTPEEPFDIREEDFTREIPEISWKDFLAMVEVLAVREFNQITSSLDKMTSREEASLKTLTPFKSTTFFKKLAAMDVDRKIINVGKAKSIGLI